MYYSYNAIISKICMYIYGCESKTIVSVIFSLTSNNYLNPLLTGKSINPFFLFCVYNFHIIQHSIINTFKYIYTSNFVMFILFAYDYFKFIKKLLYFFTPKYFFESLLITCKCITLFVDLWT